MIDIDMDYQALWQAALGELELTLSKANFTTWFKNTFISTFENGKVIVSVPNAFTKSWLEKKYQDAIYKSLKMSTNQPIREICFRVEVKNTTVLPLEHVMQSNVMQQTDHVSADTNETNQDGGSSSGASHDLGLNPRYTFEQFVIGKNNELAHATCLSVAANPGKEYNPVFIYGNAGMGKTHLLQAVGHQVLTKNPKAKICYVTCERFTNEYIQSLRSNNMTEFQNKYRHVDVLLIDDIQFLAGREGTQNEFFNTFNELHQGKKQILITSDRPPKELQSLENRLTSRFEWGMMVDISKPDFETRVAILQAKAREKNYPLSVDILHVIAGAVQSNVRELEGALNKVVAYHQFKNIQPSPQTVQPLLQSFTPTMTKRNVTPKHLIETVVMYYDITHEQILGKSRERRFALPRQIAMFLLREEIKCSFPAIGAEIGGRDHTTAMHACEKITGLVSDDDQVKRDINAIREKLYSNAK